MLIASLNVLDAMVVGIQMPGTIQTLKEAAYYIQIIHTQIELCHKESQQEVANCHPNQELQVFQINRIPTQLLKHKS